MKKIGRILEQHRHWLSQSDGMVAQELEYLEEDLARDSLEGLGNASDSLGMLAVCHGIQGEVSIYASDVSGWMKYPARWCTAIGCSCSEPRTFLIRDFFKVLEAPRI